MKKLLAITLFLFLYVFSLFSQELPQVFPVSPEAASLGKYGDIPVNLATGKINYTIPLYTIDISGFQWPIYLSYNYNGLVPEQDPPMTGLGWDLMATGRITRQVRGMPDERNGSASYKKNTVVPYLEWDYTVSDYPESNLYDLYRNVANKIFDAQQDKYHINAGNLSGSYVYNEDDEIVFLNHKNYKVNGSTNSITVTDENGIRYYFGQKEIGEFSIGQDDAEIIIPVSYLLTKIELPNNKGIVEFEYYPTISYVKNVTTETEVTGFGLSTNLSVNVSQNTVRNTPIKKITFPNGEVRFGITTAIDNDIITASLNNISVWNNNIEILNYGLAYSNANRNLKTLNSINKNSGNQVLQWYSFNYHTFPYSIDYKKQDYWGYYNNKPNTSLINGDREIDFNQTVSGALKTIHYPTGGKTDIVYEQNRVTDYVSNSNSDCSYSHNKSFTGQLIGDDGGKFIDTIITVPSNQIIKVYAYARVGNGSSNNMFGAEASISVNTTGGLESCNYQNININLSKNGEDVECFNEPGEDPCPEMFTVNANQTGYTDNAQIHITGSVIAPQNKLAKIYYKIDYEERLNGDKFVGGIRVAQTKDCNETNNCITTDYKYVNEDGLSSGNLSKANAIFSYTVNFEQEPLGFGLWSGTKYYRSSNSMQNFTSFQGAPVLYNRVELLKNGGSNGKTVQHFSAFNNSGTSSSNPFIEREKNDWKNGKLLKTQIFKKQGTQYILQQENENFYDEFFPYGWRKQSILKAYNFAAARVRYRYSLFGTIGIGLIEGDPNDYREMSTVEYPKAYIPTKSTSKEYLTGGELVTETTYSYNSPRLLLQEQKVTSSNGKIIETKTFYPDDVINTASLGNDVLSTNEFNALKKLQKSTALYPTRQNRIAEPIQVETTVKNGSTVLSKTMQRTNYKDWGNDIVLPQTMEISKGTSNLKERLIYHSYYPNGKMKESSKKNGIKTVYIWGYNEEYPIAKIENANFSDIPTSIYNSILSKSNLDDSLADEDILRAELNKLRNSSISPNLSNSYITTYTYDPLVGVTSMTDPKGYTMYYDYDDFNRLKYIKDGDGKVLSKNQYNYKN